jgi:hypothetical protein
LDETFLKIISLGNSGGRKNRRGQSGILSRGRPGLAGAFRGNCFFTRFRYILTMTALENINESYKKQLEKTLRQFRGEALALGEKFFALPETGFHEKRTEEAICACLESWQLPYQNHLALHGVRCTFQGKKPGYHVAVLADMDALLVQRGEGAVPFHSCGHSIQTVILLNLIHAFRETGVAAQLPGAVSFIFTPAEEFIEIEERKDLKKRGIISQLSGKQQMIAQGVFDDIDGVLSCHVMNPDPLNPEALFDLDASLAGFLHKRIEFTGREAHSGAIPHLGRNALHGASLSLTAIQMLKDTFPPEARVKLYPILSGGGRSFGKHYLFPGGAGNLSAYPGQRFFGGNREKARSPVPLLRPGPGIGMLHPHHPGLPPPASGPRPKRHGGGKHGPAMRRK